MTNGGAQAIQAAPRRWRFGRVRFDEAGYELLVDGQPTEVERKPLEVLRVLLEHHGKVVTKSQLVQLAWPGRVIGDAALAKAIARLREAIDDTDHQIVRTHHRYGYRLVADVEIASEAPARAAPQTGMSAPAVVSPVPLKQSTDAEHRVLTMMFCDIVDSTRLAESLDPEAFRDLLVDYQRSTSDIVRRYDGHVAQQFGDGMLFYFGYPAAHDDDAERAVRCACELLGFSNRAVSYTRMAMRVGLHTGPIVIGHSGSGGDGLATGPNLHVAARLQALAEPDTILISDATFGLVRGQFVTRDFGLQALRGMSEPVRVHQVIRPSGARSRLDAQVRLTPFVGREAEIELVDENWREAMEGRGRAILLRGEPGIGKSRLLLELRDRLGHTAHTWLEGRGDALNRHNPFHVVTGLLRRGFANEDGGEAQRLQALEQRLDDLELPRDSAIALLAPLLNLPETERYPAATLTPELRRTRTLELLIEWASRLADEQPLVLIFEDLHWCDASTLELIGALLVRLETLPVLLIMTARPEFETEWPLAARVHVTTLQGLDRSCVERMIMDLSGDRAVEAELAPRIVERAAGVPLFVEELVRATQDTGRDAAVPGSLNSLLRARLDRLGAGARELIQTAAVIGMDCELALLRHVSGRDHETLDAQLAQLKDAGLFIASDIRPTIRCAFKHALIRDSAYAALLKSARQNLHSRTASAIEMLHGQALDEHFALLAHHCEQASEIERAADFAHRAAERSLRLSANAQAIGHMTHAMRLLETLPPSPELRLRMASLQSAIASTMVALKGYADADVRVAYERARELCPTHGETATLAPILFGILAYDLVRGHLSDGDDLAKQLIAAVESSGPPEAAAAAYYVQGLRELYRGNFANAEQEMRVALEHHALGRNVQIESRFLEDAKMGALGMLAWTDWLQGFPVRSILRNQQSVDHARQLNHAFTLVVSSAVNAHVGLLRGDAPWVRELSEEGLALSRQYGFSWYEAWSSLQLGWAESRIEPSPSAIERIRFALARFRGDGRKFLVPWAISVLAEALGEAGQVNEGRLLIEEALHIATESGEHIHLAELHRLRGEIALQETPNASQAQRVEDDFGRAIRIARSQRAKGWELRAANSCARLLSSLGRQDEAVRLLRPVHASFTEGFNTPDLLEARTLLDAMT